MKRRGFWQLQVGREPRPSWRAAGARPWLSLAPRSQEVPVSEILRARVACAARAQQRRVPVGPVQSPCRARRALVRPKNTESLQCTGEHRTSWWASRETIQQGMRLAVHNAARAARARGARALTPRRASAANRALQQAALRRNTEVPAPPKRGAGGTNDARITSSQPWVAPPSAGELLTFRGVVRAV